MKLGVFFCLSILNMFLHAQNPVLLKDLNPGIASGIDEYNISGIFFNNKYFLTANNGITGLELFTLENDQIVLFKDLQPGLSGSSPKNFFIYKDKLFFTATDSLYGNEVWSTDGTIGGTMRITDVAVGAVYSNPEGFVIGGDQKLYFSSNESLYKTDGTSSGTQLINGLQYVAIGENGQASPRATAYKDGLAILNYTTSSIWIINKNGDVKQIFNTQNRQVDLLGLINIGNGLLFGIRNDLSAIDEGLYFYNGIVDSFKNISKIEPYRIIKLNDTMAFIKTYDEYYISKGTINTTFPILSNAINTITQGTLLNLVTCNNKWIFQSSDGFGDRVVSSTNGTISGTKTAFNYASLLSNFVKAGDYVFYITGYSNNFNAEISYFDCKKETTKSIYKATKGSTYIAYKPFYAYKDKLYFYGDLGQGREIYSIVTGLNITNSNSINNPKIDIYQLNNKTFRIEGESNQYTVSIINLNGVKIYESKIHAFEPFEIKAENCGLCIMKISNNNSSISMKLIIP